MSDTQENNKSQTKFSDLGLSDAILKVLDSIGYETPSPIQEQCIAHLLNGHDVIGQAQTGTGKTAAFALPLIDQIDIKLNAPQLLILAPTRELAIQVSEAVQTYARGMKGFHVLPIYGGQSYDVQLRPLKRGVHAVVGTPGRVMDHIKRGTLKLDNLKSFVLDEADEMLKMGFIDDIKWVMEHIPQERQIALFSATMPSVIKKVAEKFLNQPKIVKVKTKTETATTITQKYCMVGGLSQKLEALTRILEVITFDAMIIFTKTKTMTIELAEKLSARGFSAEAINGDIQQTQRERIINNYKKGKIDILVATDVAARGLDVERISHVVNYDIPHDPESYVHRIGRTGRAGRTGEAILFVSNRERRMLSTIERVTRQKIAPLELPTAKIINAKRVETFKQNIAQTINNQNLEIFEKLVTEFQTENPAIESSKIASANLLTRNPFNGAEHASFTI
jgi:ATP-dependent RNA helicase DeaD